jgi:anti-anti-sigma factor
VSTTSPLDVAVIAERTHVRVSPRGEIDLATCGLFEAQLDDLWTAGWEHIVVDLRDVAFMDSTGVHVLIAHHRRAAVTGGRFSIIDGTESVSRVLKITGMDQLLSYAEPGSIA